MLVRTMTDAEKRKQAVEDTEEINKYITFTLRKKLSKEIKKYNKFPRVFKTTYTTKNRNKYYLLFNVKDRTTLDRGYWVHVYTIMDSKEGKYAMIAVTQASIVESFQIYAPHLFARYTQRYGVKMYEEERIHKFMEDNIDLKYGGLRCEDGKAMARVNGGAILGDVEGDIIIFKTFVDDSLLREEQVGYGDNIIDKFNERVELFKKIFKKK